MDSCTLIIPSKLTGANATGVATNLLTHMLATYSGSKTIHIRSHDS